MTDAEPEPTGAGFEATGSYQYEPLPTREHTRVLVLGPGPRDDRTRQLVGSLRVLDLCDANSEPFEAVSYVWGPPARTHVILVDGQLLRITASLRDALLQTRLPDRPRTLWADAICINQADHAEKGHQVAAMAQIYKTSRRTLICLGVQSPTQAQTAAFWIKEVNVVLENMLGGQNLSADAGRFSPRGEAEIDTAPFDPLWSTGWGVMVRHPWFQRGWVVQEALLGPDACVLWGSDQIGWTAILRMCYWWVCRGRFAQNIQGQQIPHFLSIHHLDSFSRRRPEEARVFNRKARYVDSHSTLTTLFETRMFDLSDPRDRIYAFMALETNDGIMADLQLRPDYDRPYLEIYHDFAVKYIEKTGDLNILSFIKHNKDSLARPTTQPRAIPSWVPRWDMEPSLIHPHTAKLADQPPRFTLTGQGSVLRVRCLILGLVEYAATQQPYCQPDSAGSPLDNLLSLWSEVVAASGADEGPYIGRQAFAFFDVLCPKRQFSAHEKWASSRQDVAQFLASKPEERVLAQSSEVSTLAERVSFRGPRRFVILSRGYYGIAPPISQKGDVYAFIYGTESLSILRPAQGKPGHFQRVGPVHVESKTMLNPHGSNTMGTDGCLDWEEWGIPERDVNLC